MKKKNHKTKKKLQENSEEKESEDEKKPKDSNDNKTKNCPYCNTILDDDDTTFCPECGKSIEVEDSFNGILGLINIKKLVIISFVGIVFSLLLSLIFSFLFGLIGLDNCYSIGFFITLFIIIGFFGSCFNNMINSGLFGIIVGLAIGFLGTSIVEMSSGFSFSYEMLFGYSAVIFTIFGLIMGILSVKVLKKYIKKYVDVDNILNF